MLPVLYARRNPGKQSVFAVVYVLVRIRGLFEKSVTENFISRCICIAFLILEY